MRYRVTLDTAFAVPARDADEERAVIAFLERVLEALEARGGEEPDAGGALRTGEVHVAVSVEADEPADALRRGSLLIQQAILEAGVQVHDWSRERFVVEPEETPEPLVFAAT